MCFCVRMMPRQHHLLIIATLITCLVHGTLSASPEEGAVFWVAPSLEQCGRGTAATAKVQCNTLEGYQKNSSIFSTSHSTWIFLKGEHNMAYSPIIVSGITNITWTGEETCALGMVRCVISIPACKRYFSGYYTSHFTTIAIQNTQSIKFVFLTFSTTLQSTMLCDLNELRGNNVTLYPSILTLKHVSNAEISSTVISAMDNCLEKELTSHVEISDPRGVWVINQTVFSQINVTIDIADCLIAFVDGFKCNFFANVASTVFRHSTLATRTGATVSDTYNAISISFLQSTVFRFHLFLEDYSDIFHLSVIECNFTKIYFKVPVFSIPDTQNDITSVSILLWKVNFQYPQYSPKFWRPLLLLQIGHRNRENSGCGLLLPNITMSHIAAKYSTFTFRVKGPGQFIKYKGCKMTAPYQVLTVHNSVFEYLTPQQMPLFFPVKKRVVFTVADMGTFLVRLTGTNKILTNTGCGMIFINSQVWNDGYTVIEGNSEGGMLLHSDCLLLLSNNSVLHVFDNRDSGIFSAGLGIVGTLKRVEAASLQLWPESNICFFQFVDNQGRFIQSFDLHDFNASISASHNKQRGSWRYASNNIWNGHFDNCLLKTQNGSIPVRNNTLTRTFGTDVKLEEEATLPYKICLCSSALASGNTSLWDCQQRSTISAYPGQAKLYVSLLGDFNRAMLGKVSMVNAKNEMLFEIANCTLISLQWLTQPGEAEFAVLKLAEYYGDWPIWYLWHHIEINVIECPLGLVHVTDDTICSCNSVLNEHKFLCSIASPNFTYKAVFHGMWIGHYGEGNGSLAIGLNCPVFYCNNFIFHHGIRLEELHSRKQCQQQRTGVMCSECAEGTSSVFGSFHCQECSHGWVMLVLTFAVAGVLIIALLFVFNFTILQGTIQGIVLYVNTLGLLNDFFEEYGTKYLYIPIALMNFDLGFETCFFSGMDEFSKAILQFAFPLYLFTLLIVTITVVHKCGYKIFRYRFIARRAVPVLGTIMLLTYTDLAGAVITGLRYTSIYNAISGEEHVVWLYQPRLLYFRGQHLALGILSLAMALLYLIPFTFVMLFGDLLRRYIHKLWFSHFLDVLQGAFRWPLGFWAGLRLLLRMALIAISITSTRAEFAICTALFFFALHLLQQCIKPFRVLQYGDEHYDQQSIRNKLHLQLKLKLLSIKPPTFDSLFLLNVVAVSAVVLFSTSGGNEVIVKVLISILLLLAILECAVILIWHTYKFFPVSDKVVDRLKSFKMTLKLAFTRLVQRCQRQPKEADQDRDSPVPVFDLRFLPPTEEDLLESSASESETEEDVPVDRTRPRTGSNLIVSSRQRLPRMTGQLQESLLM